MFGLMNKLSKGAVTRRYVTSRYLKAEAGNVAQ